ncbi:MAG: hypothetical protein HQK89_02710 [Nitrospirae bacterium]|nr:hypothetical protein [Nitrospirota bacterium]
MDKKRVAFFDFSGCDGCKTQIADFGSEIIDSIGLIDAMDIDDMSSGRFKGRFDLCLVEGNNVGGKFVDSLKTIRRISDVVIAYGSCQACCKCKAFDGDSRITFEGHSSWKPVGKHSNVMIATPFYRALAADYVLDGCPVDPMEFVETIETALRTPRLRRSASRHEVKMPLYELHASAGLSPVDKCIADLIQEYGTSAGPAAGSPGVVNRYVETI